MKAFRFVVRYIRRYLWALGITVASMILLVGVQLLAPWIVRSMIAALTDPTSIGSEDPMRFITRLALLALGVYLARGGLRFVRSYMAHIAGWNVVADVRVRLYRHLQRLSLRFFEDKQTGQLMSRTVNDSDLFERLIAHAIPDVLLNILMFIGVSGVLFYMNPTLALFSLLPVPLIVFSMRIYARKVRPAFRVRQVELGELNAVLNDNLSGIREIKAFTREEVEARHVTTRVQRFRDSNLHALKFMAIFHPFIEFTSALGMIGLIYFGGRLAFNQVLPVEDLVAFFLYLEMLYQPVKALSDAWEGVQESLAGAERVAELLEEEPDVPEIAGAVDLEDRARGRLVLENVSFGYLPGERVLEDINLEIPAGHVAALVGATGVGKSTLANLIPRFYDVDEGSILLDGRNIRELKLVSLRRQISIVLQTVFLFHGTVRENILFGRPGAGEDEMRAAAAAANADEFIRQLPQGYDTMIGERGVKLSGGQRQRIAIARALLKDAPILILDEATSAVDTETERKIQEALERLMIGRTTLIIAHRLSTIRSADQIVVLEGSRVAEKGTHSELMSQNGLYRHFVMIQEQGGLQTEEAAASRGKVPAVGLKK